MMHKVTLRAMLLSGVCLLPLGAMAADLGTAPPPAPAPVPAYATENELTFGVLGVFGKNTGQYGRYNGLTMEGVDSVGSFSSVTYPVWDSGGTMYYEFGGDNLDYQFGRDLGTATAPAVVYPSGAIAQVPIDHFKDSSYVNQTHADLGPEADLHFSIGDQGHWGVDGYYRAITYTGNIIDSIYTVGGKGPFPTGALNGSLVKWSGIDTGTAQDLVLSGAETPFQTGTRRDIVGFLGKYVWHDWTITGKVSHQHKEGSLEESYYGPWGGTAFTLPVDFDFERYDVTADYATPQVQAEFNYYLSNFNDNDTGVLLPWPTAVAQTSLYSTPPSSWAQYWTGMVGYNILPSTRFNANARFGLEKQDKNYPSSTGDPFVNGTPGGIVFPTDCNGTFVGTSSCSLNATADVFQGNASLSTSPITDLNARVEYGIDTRRVHIDQAGGVFGDNHDPDAGPYNQFAFVVPQEWTKQKVKADIDYLFSAPTQTKLQLGYVYHNVDRTNAQVGHSHTNTGTVALSGMLRPDLIGRITYEHDERSGTLKYWTAWGNLESGDPNDIAAGTPSGAYYQAPMTADGGTARLDYAPQGPFSGGLQFKGRDEHFHYPSILPGVVITNRVQGIQEDYNLTAGIDGNYRPSAAVNLHAYYTYERIFFNNTGNGGCSTPGQAVTAGCAGTVGYFQNKDTTDVHTVGLDAEWHVTDKLKLSADYTFQYGSIMFGEFNGVFVPPANVTAGYQNVTNYPDMHSTMNALTLKAKYQLSSNTQLALIGGWSAFRFNDWNDLPAAVETRCTPGVGACSAANGSRVNILTPGYRSPDYNVGLVEAALKVKW